MRSTSPLTGGAKSLKFVSLRSSTLFEGDANHLGQLMMLKTNIPDQIRRSVNEESVSVIHAPESFRSWVGLPDAFLLRLT